jgi:hypothetical protein
MGYEDLFKPENVLALAKLTDESQKSYFKSESLFDPIKFESHRKMIYEKKLEMMKGLEVE